MLYFYGRTLTLYILFSVLFHEFGHLLTIYMLGGGVSSLHVSVFGVIMKRKNRESSAFRECAVFLSGPLASVLLFVICRVCGNTELSYVSLFYGLINLLPIGVFDGGRALQSVLSIIFSDPYRERRISAAAGALTLLFLWLVSVYLMIISENFIPMFFMCAYLFFLSTRGR